MFGGFIGLCYPGLINGALYQVTSRDAGLGAGVQNTMQQVGAALGLAALVTLALRYTQQRLHAGVLPAVAQTDGYALAFRVSAAALAVAGVLVLVVLECVSAQMRDPLAEVPAPSASDTPIRV